MGRLEEFLKKNRKTLDFEQMEKVLEGLYYCFWHSDKTPYQDALARRLAELIHVFKGHEKKLLWTKGYL